MIPLCTAMGKFWLKKMTIIFAEYGGRLIQKAPIHGDSHIPPNCVCGGIIIPSYLPSIPLPHNTKKVWQTSGKWCCSSYECFILRARRLSRKLLKQRYLVECLKSSFRKIYGRYVDLLQHYEVSLLQIYDILTLDQQFLLNRSDFHRFHDLDTDLEIHRIMKGSNGAFATGVACMLGTLTLPDTWFRHPFRDLLVLQLLRPDFSNLPGIYSTFHLEYPSVLFQFCFRFTAF